MNDQTYRDFKEYLRTRKLHKSLALSKRRKARGVQHVDGRSGRASSGDKS